MPPRVLLLGHHDTVWPIGSLTTHPFEVVDGVLRGPGCFDMKAGVVMAFHAVRTIREASGVSILITGDEELGSPSSRALIEAEAAGCQAAFVLEASAAGGALKTERKGVSALRTACPRPCCPRRPGARARRECRPRTRAPGPCGEPRRRLVRRHHGHTDDAVRRYDVEHRAGRGRLQRGRARTTEAEQARVDRELRALRPVLEGAHLDLTGGPNRPPLPAAASAGLYARAHALAAGSACRRRRPPRSVAGLTATSLRGLALRPSTDSARWAGAPMPMTSTSWWRSCRGVRVFAALVQDQLQDQLSGQSSSQLPSRSR